MSERNTTFLLSDIYESIENIISFTSDISFETYCSNIKTKHAVQHNFMMIGEASARIPAAYKMKYGQINWRQIKDFRNVIVHDYFGIDDSIVWDIIKLNMPELKDQVFVLLSEENSK